jgi:hypothetical protein
VAGRVAAARRSARRGGQQRCECHGSEATLHIHEYALGVTSGSVGGRSSAPPDTVRGSCEECGVIIDYLLSKDGLRLDLVDVTLAGVRLSRRRSGFVAQSATEISGTLRVTLADLSAAIARPEVIDQLLLGVPGIARPELSFVNGDNGGVRIVGSVEALGRRIPITASTHVRVGADRFIVSPVRLEGLPLIGALPIQLPDLEIPANLPLGLQFTSVTTEPGYLLLTFSGTDVRFQTVDDGGPDAEPAT